MPADRGEGHVWRRWGDAAPRRASGKLALEAALARLRAACGDAVTGL